MNRLKQLRLDAHLSVDELAEKTGIPKTTIWNLEAGRVASPHVTTLAPLAEFFEVKASELVPEPQREAA